MLPGVAPLEVYVRDVAREAATAEPLLVLHGGWGYEFYPFDAQIAELTDRRIVIPDRTGYGKSPHLAALPPGFHHRAAAEHEALLDALAIDTLPDVGLRPPGPSDAPQEAQDSPIFIRNPVYGTRCSTVVAIDAEGQGVIIERRFDANGAANGETSLTFSWPR